MLSVQTVQLINSFGCGVEDQHAQNVLLHAIFSRIIMSDHVEHDPVLFLQTCMTLARLYWDQNWDPAGVFLYMLTGYLIEEDAPLVLSQLAFPQLNNECRLNPETINGTCDLHAELFNVLWFNHDTSDDEEEEEEEESESGDSSESD